jgi:UDP-galactopyranose mutase
VINNIDVVIAGAGLSGLTAARALADDGKKVLVIEKNTQVGGHCYDYLNDKGILVQKYGPHIFHTKKKSVWNFMSRFTDWYYYHHEVKGLMDGQMVPIPFNLNSITSLFPRILAEKLESKLLEKYPLGSRVPILELKKSEDEDLQFLAQFVYEKIFLNYTAKQWGGKKPEELDSAVSARVPVLVSKDNGYFQDPYQGIPMKGYTKLMERMADHQNIHLLLNTRAEEVVEIKDGKIFIGGKTFSGKYIFTGPVDQLFGECYGELPYRSVDMKMETFAQEGYNQETGVVNYPNNYDFTRITEFKHFQRDSTMGYTTLCREFPQEYVKGKNAPFYIVNNKDSQELYEKYKALEDGVKNLYCLGRLGEYKYYNMDEAVASGLKLVEHF